MSDIELTEPERAKLIQCLNQGIEPPADLAKKLFPSVCGVWDVRTLNRASIPTIEYAGKRSEAAILNEASAFGAGAPLQVVRFFHGGKLKPVQQLDFLKESGPTWETGWKNMIVQGDNLQFLKTCYLDQDPLIRGKVKGKVKLVYIDPPFATKGDFAGDGGEESYADKVDRAEFVEQIRERLVFLREVLASDGSIYVHLDQRMSSYIRLVMDEVFGRDGLKNEIVWQRTNTHNEAGQYGRIHDIVLFYTKSIVYPWNPQRIDFSPEQMKRYKQDERGRWYTCQDMTAERRNSDSGKFEWRGTMPSPTRGWGYKIEQLEEWWEQGRIATKRDGTPRMDGLIV